MLMRWQIRNDDVSSAGDMPPVYLQNDHASPTDSTVSMSIFRNRFVIATKEDSLSSGFPFDERLYSFGVNHDQWHLFTNEIVNAAKLTFGSDWAAWSTGVAVGTVSSCGLLVFGPVAGYYAARPLHRKAVVNNVKKELMHDGQVRMVLRRWNEQTFAQKGFQAWLELPRLSGELKTDPAATEDKKMEDKNYKKLKKLQKIEARRFRIIIIPDSSTDSSSPLSSSLALVGRGPPPVPFVEASADRPVGELPSNSPTTSSPTKNLPMQISQDALRSAQAVPMELEGDTVPAKQ